MVKILYIEYEKKVLFYDYFRKVQKIITHVKQKQHCNMSMVKKPQKKQEIIDLNHPTLYFVGTDTK